MRFNRFRRFLIGILSILMLVSWCGVTAETAEKTIRVRLTRLGSTSSIVFSVNCDYSLNDGTRILAGSEVTAEIVFGHICLTFGGERRDVGTECAILRTGTSLTGITFLDPGLPHLYCGDLMLTTKGSILMPVMVMNIEDYLKGVVADAMPEGSAPEALKAMAVAARTYAVKKQEVAAEEEFDVTDSASDQVFSGCDLTRVDAMKAVDDTAGEILMYNGKTAVCYTTRSNGGQTESAGNAWGASLAYSTVKDDPYDEEDSAAKTRSITLKGDCSDIDANLRSALIAGMADELENAGLSTSDGDVSLTQINSIEASDPTGDNSRTFRKLVFEISVRSVNLATGKPVTRTVKVPVDTYGALENWEALSINDADNEIVSAMKIGDDFRITFRREGHGVGLSRSGARVMAANYGKSEREILEFYYPGTEIKGGTDKPVLPERTAEVSEHMLPTLQPRETVEPTATTDFEPTYVVPETTTEIVTPEPTISVVFLNDDPIPEPEVSSGPEDIFAPSENDMFIAGSKIDFATPRPADNGANLEIPAMDMPDEIDISGIEFDTGDEPDLNVDDSVLGELDTEGDPDEIDITGIEFDTSNDLDLNVDDSVLGAPDTGNDPDEIDITGIEFDTSNDLDLNVSDSVLGELDTGNDPDEIDISNIDFGTENDLDTNVDDSVLGDPEMTDVESALSKMKKPGGEMYGTVTVQEGSTLTLREMPSTSARAVLALKANEEIRVKAYDSAWLYVETATGRTGFVSRDYVLKSEGTNFGKTIPETSAAEDNTETRSEEPAEAFKHMQAADLDLVFCDIDAATTSNVRLHTDSSIDSPSLLTIPAGEQVNVRAYNGEWAYVTYGDKKGYVSIGYLRKAG